MFAYSDAVPRLTIKIASTPLIASCFSLSCHHNLGDTLLKKCHPSILGQDIKLVLRPCGRAFNWFGRMVVRVGREIKRRCNV